VRFQLLPQRSARSMKPHHRVVRCQVEFVRRLRDGDAVKDDALKDLRMSRLEQSQLCQHTPAFKPICVLRSQALHIARSWRFGAAPHLVKQHISGHTGHPSFSACWLTQLLGTLQGTLRSTLKNILWVHLSGTLSTNHGKERDPLSLDRVPNGCIRCTMLLHSHMLLRKQTSAQGHGAEQRPGRRFEIL
jgi:hypothetical protein